MVPGRKELKSWDRLVDLVTVVWLGFFVAGLIKPGEVLTNVQLGLLGVFVADLVVKYRSEGNVRTFVQRRWMDILMVIPYFRIFRILRLLRLVKVLKVARISRVGRFPGLKQLGTAGRKASSIASKATGEKHG